MGSVRNPPNTSRTLYQQSYITNLPQSSVQFPQPMIEIFHSSYSDSEKIFRNVPFNWPGVGQKSSAIFRSISPANDRNLPQSSVQFTQTLKKKNKKNSALFRSIGQGKDKNLPQSSVQFTQSMTEIFQNIPQSSIQLTQTLKKLPQCSVQLARSRTEIFRNLPFNFPSQ